MSIQTGRPTGPETPDVPPMEPDLPVPGDPVAPDVYPDPMPDREPAPTQDPQRVPPGEITPPIQA